MVCNSAEKGEPVKIARSLMVSADMSWHAYVHGMEVVLPNFSSTLTIEEFDDLFQLLAKSSVCCGNHDARYINMCRKRKGVFQDRKIVKLRTYMKGTQLLMNLVIFSQLQFDTKIVR